MGSARRGLLLLPVALLVLAAGLLAREPRPGAVSRLSRASLELSAAAERRRLQGACPTNMQWSDQRAQCECAQGTYYMPASGTNSVATCTACPLNHFQDTPGLNRTCIACGDIIPHSTTLSTGAVSVQQCKCINNLILREVSATNVTHGNDYRSWTNSSNPMTLAGLMEQQVVLRCMCMPGEFFEPKCRACFPCPEGRKGHAYYQPAWNLEPSCLSCNNVLANATTNTRRPWRTPPGTRWLTKEAHAALCRNLTRTYGLNPGACDPHDLLNKKHGVTQPFAADRTAQSAGTWDGCVCPAMHANVSNSCHECRNSQKDSKEDSKEDSEEGQMDNIVCLCPRATDEDARANIAKDFVASEGQCKCPPGTFFQPITPPRCKLCPILTYMNAINLVTKCIPCSHTVKNVDCNHEGMTSANFSLHPGKWRVDEHSLVLHDCPIPAACLGGARNYNWPKNHTNSGQGRCYKTNTGPLCMLCIPGWARMEGEQQCMNCHGDEAGERITHLILLILILVVSIAICQATGEGGRLVACSDAIAKKLRDYNLRSSDLRGRKAVYRILLTRYKIWCGLIQIISSIPSLYPIDFGHVQREMGGGILKMFGGSIETYWHDFTLIELNFAALVPVRCMFSDVSFYDLYTVRILLPIIIVCMLLVLQQFSGRDTRLTIMWAIVLYLWTIYPFISAQVMKLFDHKVLENGECYLKADYSVSCTDRLYSQYQLVGCIAIFLYPIGIPAVFYALLHRVKDELESRDVTKTFSISDLEAVQASDAPLSDSLVYLVPLFNEYRPQCWWYEVLEFGRKSILTYMSIMWFQEKSTKIVIAVVLCAFYIIVFTHTRPYIVDTDNFLQETALWVTLFVFFFGLCNRLGEQIISTACGERGVCTDWATDMLNPVQFRAFSIWVIWIFHIFWISALFSDIRRELGSPCDVESTTGADDTSDVDAVEMAQQPGAEAADLGQKGRQRAAVEV